MSFDLGHVLDLVTRHGPVARVVVAGTRGSAPREPGASMCVWDGGQDGTIGGGALEWEAAARARACIAGEPGRVDTLPLGPALGQCCGGQVTLITEVWDAARLAAAAVDGIVARPLPGRPSGNAPLSVRRLVAAARARGALPGTTVADGWLIEPVSQTTRMVWIYGAGHVGRALAGVLSPLPGFAVTLIDEKPARFPETLLPDVTPLVAANPADAVRHAPGEAQHLVLTYSHALDLEICHRILSRDFHSAGLIGSATKWARFRRKLAALGHSPEQIGRITCPIGDPALGKHPQAIALGVAAAMIRPALATSTELEAR